MKRFKILTKAAKINDVDLDDLLEDSDDWRLKAERLQARRWHKLKNEMI